VPTLLVSGAESPAHIKAVTDRLAKLVPDADRLTIAGATHNMFNSHPAQFNTGVRRFIRSHSGVLGY
jgi:pimeloyl-ACP methyl ester carboxylesterase